MARVAIQIAESALTDLDSIRTWYAEQDVPVALQLHQVFKPYTAQPSADPLAITTQIV